MAITSSTKSNEERLTELNEEVRSLDMQAHWWGFGESKYQKPQVWRWADIYRCLMEAGEVMPVGTDFLTDRRSLILNTKSATLTLAFQLLLPGERAQAHRHNFSAIRFVVEGGGAYSTAAGEQMIMEPGDLLTQPNWAWHDHHNPTNEPCIWLDGLEARLSRVFQASFHETWPEGVSQPVAKPDGYCRQVYGPLRPPATLERGVHPPGFSYKWGDTLRSLKNLAGEGQADPYDGVLLEYTNPVTGGRTFPIMTCYIQMLRPGEKTRRHRHTGTTQHHVVRGNGVTMVDEAVTAPPGEDPQEPVLSAAAVDLEWGEKDCFIVPSWRWHSHQNNSRSEPAIFFSMSDRPILEAAGLYREEGG